MIGGHFYLWSELAGLPALAVALVCAGDQRRPAIVAGLAFALFFPLCIIYDNAYWKPQRLLGGRVGVEDLMFTFRFGALSWLGAFWPWRRYLHIGVPTPRSLEILVFCVAAGALGIWLLAHIVSVMWAFIVVQSGLAIFLIFLRLSLSRCLPGSLLLLPGYHALHLLLFAGLLPGFAAMWARPQAYIATVVGIPLEEFLWAISASVCVPYLFAVARNVEIEQR